MGEVSLAVQLARLVGDALFDQQPGSFVLKERAGAHDQGAKAELAAQDFVGGWHHIAGRKPVAQQVGERAGVQPVALALARADGSELRRLTHLQGSRIGLQKLVKAVPANRGFQPAAPGVQALSPLPEGLRVAGMVSSRTIRPSLTFTQ